MDLEKSTQTRTIKKNKIFKQEIGIAKKAEEQE